MRDTGRSNHGSHAGARVLMLTAMFFLLITAGCSRKEPSVETAPETEAAIEIKTVVAREIGVQRRAEVVGSILSYEQVTVQSEVPGFVQTITVDFGSPVRRGQLLVTVDPKEYELDVQRAEAGLAEALSALGLPPDGDASAVEIEKTAAVAQVAASLADVRTKLRSAQKLIQTGDIPEQRYLELQQLEAAQEAALRAARDRVRAQIAAVQGRRADLDLARRRLASTRLHAPLDGSVVAKHVSPGQFIKDNVALLTLAQTDPIRLRARIPEGSVAAVRKGMELTFRVDAYPGREFTARVTDVSPVLDTESRTLVAEAVLPNPEKLLRPGMFARISALVSSDSPAVVVPEAALLPFAGLTKLFVIGTDGSVKVLSVQTGARHEGLVEILGGAIRAGDKVATANLAQLGPGVRVIEKHP